ncbi:unnamed protein product, partial [Mesorhabditis belari]|uniref:Uncharacterized protein n=1 Tax=Mesorhabditis belari TaxID=2138241 RepID=A0AAF3EKK6_9BILA
MSKRTRKLQMSLFKALVIQLAMIYFITDYRNAVLRHSCLPAGITTSLMSADLNATETAAESKSKTIKWPLIFRSLRVRPKIATHVLKVVVINFLTNKSLLS